LPCVSMTLSARRSSRGVDNAREVVGVEGGDGLVEAVRVLAAPFTAGGEERMVAHDTLLVRRLPGQDHDGLQVAELAPQRGEALEEAPSWMKETFASLSPTMYAASPG